MYVTHFRSIHIDDAAPQHPHYINPVGDEAYDLSKPLRSLCQTWKAETKIREEELCDLLSHRIK